MNSIESIESIEIIERGLGRKLYLWELEHVKVYSKLYNSNELIELILFISLKSIQKWLERKLGCKLNDRQKDLIKLMTKKGKTAQSILEKIEEVKKNKKSEPDDTPVF